VIDEVLLDLAQLTAAQVIDRCRADAAWRLTEDGATIPYHLAFVPQSQLVTPTAIELAKDVAEQYGLTG
jgi:hypothetical protein